MFVWQPILGTNIRERERERETETERQTDRDTDRDRYTQRGTTHWQSRSEEP